MTLLGSNFFNQMFPIPNFESFWKNIDISSLGRNCNYGNAPLHPVLFDFSGSNYIGDSITFSTNVSKLSSPVATENKVPELVKKYGLDNYNPTIGKNLARNALENAKGFKGRCAAYVKQAIVDSNLGTYQSGHAYQMSGILRNNKNFEEISPADVNVKDLPAGCVLVYDKGARGYSKKYGHTEITTGDGRAVSDGITRNLHRKPSAIFVPISS